MEVRATLPPGFKPERSDRSPRVYDGFAFFNELDVLEIRLNELADVVDYFVLAEARETFRGQPKEYVFLDNRERFSPFSDKIIHLAIENFDNPGSKYQPMKVKPSDRVWTREGAQRNALVDGFARAMPLDWLMVSDLDEIPRADIVRSIAREPMYRRCGFVFEQDFYQNRLNWRVPSPTAWCGTRMIEKRFMRTPHGMRRYRHNASPKSMLPWLDWRAKAFWDLRSIVFPQRVPSAGWHFTSMGDAQAVYKKLTSYAHWHADLDQDFVALEKIQKRLDEGRPHSEAEIEIAPLRDLPAHVELNAEKYAHLLDLRASRSEEARSVG